ncbi:flagellar biosynthesis anti-sigma factor FlgM [Photobacterium damselae subsp. damselae]|uniref:flagellar biosynthesis anti-sigma factor FlgM n=1 Tax=Photobacterium damselae TaxID=38293 RepID=UPI000A2F9C6C|nr:flagellar biosynthesis anti-sigma factor FlgM [Photobacterium damselae]ARR48705.1 flagellar biosynthesis anti-sigma factor FlgM [Photobacterium damselae subsp. damselae]QAY34258.1 flagellar biosynthesis anti-sigma factor FlgM [Photobacterium damselae subsp. damselae]
MAGIDQLRQNSQAMTIMRSQQQKVNDNASSTSNTTASTTPTQHDEISLSAQGKAVGQIHQQLATEPSFDADKVAKIKEAISNGSYKVDPDKLASNIMKFENELKDI